jgi:predicted NAD/FAD-dependent oxidoreductase
MPGPNVFIVGAGVAGLACAKVLRDNGIDVRLGDKGRGPGGRCSTRRSPAGRFDHGANYFTARDPVFRRQVDQWCREGLAAEWRPQTGRDGEPSELGEALYVGTPWMSAVIAAEAEASGAEFGLEIGMPQTSGSGRYVLSTREAGHLVAEADVVVFSCPAPQAAALLPEGELKEGAEAASYAPCYTLMAAFDRSDLRFGLETFSEGPLDAVFEQAAKPGRAGGSRIVAHASPDFSTEILEEDPDIVSARMMSALRAERPDLGKAGLTMVHRWRYARVTETAPGDFGLDMDRGLATCGDWHIGPRVEAAWLSGHRLGQALVAAL